jgi:uncharacterized protein
VGTASALATALGLFLVLEGLLPLIAPRAWRQAIERMTQFNDGQLRFVGLALVGTGVLLLWL